MKTIKERILERSRDTGLSVDRILTYMRRVREIPEFSSFTFEQSFDVVDKLHPVFREVE